MSNHGYVTNVLWGWESFGHFAPLMLGFVHNFGIGAHPKHCLLTTIKHM